MKLRCIKIFCEYFNFNLEQSDMVRALKSKDLINWLYYISFNQVFR